MNDLEKRVELLEIKVKLLEQMAGIGDFVEKACKEIKEFAEKLKK